MTIDHDAAARRFIARLPAGEAVLSYAYAGDGVLDLRSTFVPPSARGRGVAAALVEAALAFAREEGHRVIPSCWYVREWITAHPDQEDLLAS